MTVYLCGFMGCGKSTIGKILAKKLGVSYYDTDFEIVNKVGLTIPEIFNQKGEEYFRKIEAEVVDSLGNKSAVISCGGGALLNPDTAKIARQKGCIIFIDVPFEVCYTRIKDDPNRPIAISSSKDELLNRFETRYDIYSSHSNIKVDCNHSPLKATDAILSALKLF